MLTINSNVTPMKKVLISGRVSERAKKLFDDAQKKTGLHKQEVLERCIKAHAPTIIRNMKP